MQWKAACEKITWKGKTIPIKIALYSKHPISSPIGIVLSKLGKTISSAKRSKIKEKWQLFSQKKENKTIKIKIAR